MAKTTPIKKLLNGEIADADDVNQIAENVGSEGGLLPYEPSGHALDASGSQSLGSTAYPWGSLKINQDAELVEVNKDSHTAVSSVAFKDLRKFISQKDTPASYSGKRGMFTAVNSGETALEFVNPPTKSTLVFCWNGMDDAIKDVAGLLSNAGTLVPDVFSVNHCFFAVYSNTFRVILRSRFTKTSGISTITIDARLWGSSYQVATLSVDVGGVSNTVTGPADVTPAWVASRSTIDVSGLTLGNTYDITISLKSTSGNEAYCSAVVLNGT